MLFRKVLPEGFYIHKQMPGDYTKADDDFGLNKFPHRINVSFLPYDKLSKNNSKNDFCLCDFVKWLDCACGKLFDLLPTRPEALL